MKRLGWPFLVSCNRQLDYRAVVAPELVIRARATRSLADAVGDDFENPGVMTYRTISLPQVGMMSLVYRAVRATSELVGESGSEVLRDDWGRPIYLIEGIASESPDVRESVTEKDLLALHNSLAEEFRIFWGSDKWQPKSSSVLSRLGDGTLEKSSFQEAPVPTPPPVQRPAPPASVTPARPFGSAPSAKRTTWSPERVVSLEHPSREEIVSLTFSPDGDYLVSKTIGQELAVWRAADSRLMRCLRLGPLTARSRCQIGFEAGSSAHIVTGIKSERSWLLVRYNLEMNEELPLCEVPYDPLLVACPPREEQVYTSGSDRATIWDIRRPIFRDPSCAPVKELAAFTAFATSRDGTLQATGDRNGTIRLYEDSLRNVTGLWPHTAGISFLAVSRNAHHLLGADTRGQVWCWSCRSGSGRHLYSHTARIVGLSTGVKEDVLSSGDTDGAFVFWNLRTSSRVDMHLDEGSLSSFALSPASEHLAAAVEPGKIQIFSLRGLPL